MQNAGSREKGAYMGRRRKKRGCLGFFLCMAALCLIIAAAFSILVRKGIEHPIVDQLVVKEEVPFQEISVEEESLAGKYYYGLLAEEEKQIYKELVQGVKEAVPEIYVHCGDANEANEIFQYVCKDFPEIFWCEGGASSVSYDEGDSGYTAVKPEYNCSIQEIQRKQAEIDAEVTSCLFGISAEASDYEKILYVYEYIVNTVDYDLNAEDNQNIYSVFGNKRSVCAGYSKAAQYLLERLGIFCTYVTGTAGGQEAHAWNLVQCEGAYYYVDTTWGDPVYQQSEGEDVQEWQNISYDYMCCSDTELFKTHTLDAGISFPPCTSMDWNYYVVNGMYYENFDSQTILKAMNQVISKKGNPVVLKFASGEVYAQARDEVLGDLVQRAAQNLASMYGLSQVQYYYQDEAELSKITIYWQYE